MPFMEGALWKWTNYVTGWQLRWFVLDHGVLSYYKSQDDVKLGSRGSVKMGCCDVTAQSGDPLKIILKFPPDHYMYLKATTASERQQWVVALGSSKACLTLGNHGDSIPTNQANESDDSVNPEKALHKRMSEIHVCRNILLDQISAIKNLCDNKDTTQEFHEAGTLLSATCDAFLINLEACVKISEHKFGSGTPLSSPLSPVVNHDKNHLHRVAAHSHENQSNRSAQRTSSNSTLQNGFEEKGGAKNFMKNEKLTKSGEGDHTRTDLATNLDESFAQELKIKEIETQPTIFSTAPNRFTDINMLKNNHIPTKPFLLACNSILPIFDVLGRTAFAPVKMDISGNIKKLTSKYDNDPTSCSTLQAMIGVEIHSNTCNVKNSATDALLWLKRALEFTNVFLLEINKGERELVVVASNAYSKTLRKYHGWMVRGMFAP
ncbi:pleckstrin homology domain-containing family A member 8-like isoform X2 [Xenia sp. Carnegie-2017]|uniref:pleckstrin homology domain-containing family A member 8-like isoform X2 n=1 Tax=Xenia sp. Carnegie-2017 TaxID=2897299 RepID=UPI001F044670|nr:pleckstrin homology domain-containing family A member 8-like isoform X2 [Xenia sp. Carnegie-2017]